MEQFFHINPKRFITNRRISIAIVATLTGLSALISAAFILLGPSGAAGVTFLFLPFRVLTGSILLGMQLFLLFWFFYDRSLSRHSRYTYLNLLPGTLVFSRYAGEFKTEGKKQVLRKLYVIKMKDITEIKKDDRTNAVILNGKIRFYESTDNRMGYQFRRGELKFDHWWLNEVQYQVLDTLTIPDVFSDADEVYKAIKLNKKRSESMQNSKPFTLQEPRIIRQRKILKRELPDSFSYKRDWSL